MRMQHNIIPPAPGRGGNRKRKRDEPEVPTQTNDGYGTFKVDPPEGDLDDRMSPVDMNGHEANGLPNHHSFSPDPEDESSGDEGIPVYLRAQLDPSTGLINGRTPAMVKYLIMKAKHRYVLEEHAGLLEELRTIRAEEQRWRNKKNALLDQVLEATFG